MKKLILISLLLCIFFDAEAQKKDERYVKHIFGIGQEKTYVQGWKGYALARRNIIDDINYTFFYNKSWGIGLRFHRMAQRITLEDELRIRSLDTNNYADSIWYGDRYSNRYNNQRIPQYKYFRGLDIPIYYRFNYKRHSLLASLGIAYRYYTYDEAFRLPSVWHAFGESFTLEHWGWCASTSYQYRVLRNFGLSFDAVIRRSKDIPNTLSLTIGLTYNIYNKRRERSSTPSTK